jgi:serine phosphatase RsbU (regulator of sigma subunit)
MAQMRASIRAYLCIDESPAQVIEKLDAMYERLGLQGLATLSYVLIDCAGRELHVVNAGHYPPVLVGADGTVQFARPPTQRPFGVGGDERVDSIWPFRGGETLLLYTDGVVERRVESIDEGLARLASAASILAGDGLQESLDRLVDGLRDEALDDDVTAVAVRLR